MSDFSTADFSNPKRNFILGSAAAALAGFMPRPGFAAGSLAASIYPGPWEEAYRSLVVPRVKQASDIDVQLYPLLSADQIAKARASRNEAAFDVFTLDPGPRGNAIDLNLFEPFDRTKLANASKLPSSLVDQHGVAVAGQLVGIAYNPKKLDRPRGWADLFQPKFASRLGLTGFQTTFGAAALIEIAKTFGGSESNIEPALDQIKKILPTVAAVAQPLALTGLFQQGQIDLMYTNTQFVEGLKAQGVDIEFVVPESGAVAFFTTMHLARHSKQVPAAYAYLDTVLSAPVQEALSKKPYYFIPVNVDVPFGSDLPVRSFADMSKFVVHDWLKINAVRPQWIERFNREVAK
jgi:putative spermidine/putrescine transport system substrate-binding protein